MIMLRKDFKVLPPKKTYSPSFYYQSWYSPIFLKKRTADDDDESCCITFQVRKDGEDNKYLVLANILMPNRFSSYDVMIHAKNLSNDFTNNTLKERPPLYSQKCVIIPANENEPNAFASEAQRKHIPIQRLFIENHGGDLEGLIHRAISIAKQNRFCLILDSKNENMLRPIDERFLDMIIRHPSKDSYAISYAWAQGLIYGERYLGLFEKEAIRKSKQKSNFYWVDL